MSYTQEYRVLVQNAKTTHVSAPLVNVKWYGQSLVYPKGVNIYRRETGQETWIKLNKLPLLIQKTVPASLLKRDADLEAFLEMAKEIGPAKDNGFLLLNLFVKSFQSADFSRLIGIQYDDASVTWGASYEYRVVKIENNSEIELATSSTVKIEEYKASKAVNNFKVVLEQAIAKLAWEEDQDRFYGINIYRSSSADSAWRRLNKTPIVQSATDGAPALEAMYQDNQLKEGTIYQYKIAGLDFFGEETALSDGVEIQLGDLTPPPPPVNLEKKVDILDIAISWTPQPTGDLIGYQIYRSAKSDGVYEKINKQLINKTDTVYQDKVPQPGFYYYYVTAVDESGNEGKSEKVLVEVQDMIPPSTPQHVMAKADSGKITLTWSANSEKDLMGYYIYRTIENSQKENFILSNAEPLRDTIFTQVFAKNASNKFLFKIAAVDTSFNVSQPSEIVTARLPDVTPPITPIIKQIINKGDSIMLSWLPNPELDLKGFTIYRYKATEPNNKTIINQSPISPNVLSFTDTLGNEGRYFYVLQAVDVSGNLSPLSEPYPIEIMKSFSFSFNRLDIKYLKRKRSVLVQWVGSTKPVGYTVFRKPAGSSAWKPVTGLLQADEATDAAIEKKSAYEYHVRAYSAEGDVVVSKSVSIITGK